MRSASITGVSAATARPVADVTRAEITPRVVSAAVLVPVVLAAAYAGGFVFAALIAVFAVVMTWEWARVTAEGRFGGEGVVLVAVVAAALGGGLVAGPVWGIVVAGAGAIAAAAVLRQMNADHPGWAAAGIPYVAVPALSLIWLRGETPAGFLVVLWLFAVVWATDIAAYFAGRQWGTALLAPTVSPRKTWAGAIGGLIAALAVSLAAAPLVGPADPVALIILGAVVSIAGQFGDLFESAVKRRFGVKDTSEIIPGHGGALDRADSLIAAAPIVALALWSGVLSPWP